MTWYDRQIGVGLWIATSIFIVVFFFDSMSSAGIDLADHNAVVNRLFDHWGMPITDDLYSFYHSYPVFSHIAAAVLALLLSVVNPPFTGRAMERARTDFANPSV
jgi:hypothetical protein